MLFKDMRKMYSERQIGDIAKKVSSELFVHLIEKDENFIQIISTTNKKYDLSNGKIHNVGSKGIVHISYYDDGDTTEYICHKLFIVGVDDYEFNVYNVSTTLASNVDWTGAEYTVVKL